VPIPGRKVNAQFKAVFLTGSRQHRRHIPGAGGRHHAVLGVRRIEKAEPVMMLRREDAGHDAGGFKGFAPLICIKPRRVVQGRAFLPCAPFAVRKGINSKMEKSRKTQLLPGDLAFLRPHLRQCLNVHYLS